MADLNQDIVNVFKPLMAAWFEKFGKLDGPVQESWNKDFACMGAPDVPENAALIAQ